MRNKLSQLNHWDLLPEAMQDMLCTFIAGGCRVTEACESMIDMGKVGHCVLGSKHDYEALKWLSN